MFHETKGMIDRGAFLQSKTTKKLETHIYIYICHTAETLCVMRLKNIVRNDYDLCLEIHKRHHWKVKPVLCHNMT